MSPESQGCSSTHVNTTEVELQPRTSRQAIAVPEDHNDAVGLEPSQAESCDGQPFASHNATSERPRSREQTSDGVSATPAGEMGSTSRDVQLDSTAASVSEDVGLEADAAVAAQRHSSQNGISENERLSPQVERMLLNGIRDEILYQLGVTAEGTQDILMDDSGTRTMRFQFGVGVNETVELAWGSLSRTKKDIEVARVERMIRGAWTKSRLIPRLVEQHIIESGGRSPAIKAQWSSVGKVYQDELNSIGQGPFATVLFRDILYSGYESLWHSWCYVSRGRLSARRDQKVGSYNH
jgi:hypothetical protein